MITMARWDADPHISPDQIFGQACAVKCNQKRGLKRRQMGQICLFKQTINRELEKKMSQKL
jgi:hypothetical protein